MLIDFPLDQAAAASGRFEAGGGALVFGAARLLLIVIRHRLTAQGNGQVVLDHGERGATRLLEESWFLHERLGAHRHWPGGLAPGRLEGEAAVLHHLRE